MFETVADELRAGAPIGSWRRTYRTTESRIVDVLVAMETDATRPSSSARTRASTRGGRGRGRPQVTRSRRAGRRRRLDRARAGRRGLELAPSIGGSVRSACAADAQGVPSGVRMRRYVLPFAIAAATLPGFVVVARQTAGERGARRDAARTGRSSRAAFAVGAVVQPLRALAWRQTLGAPVEFRAIYAVERDRLLPRHGPPRPARRGVEGRRPPGRRPRALAGPAARGREPPRRAPDGGDRVLPRRRDRRLVPARSRRGCAGRCVGALALAAGGILVAAIAPPQDRPPPAEMGRRVPRRRRRAAPRAAADAGDPARHLGRALDRRRC